MDRSTLKRMIQQEIARVREDALFPSPELGEIGYRASHEEDVCPECDEDPCACDDYDDTCFACGMNPCRCMINKKPSYKLSCSACGGVTVMQEGGCGCGGTGVTKASDQMLYMDVLKHMGGDLEDDYDHHYDHHEEEEEVEVHHGGAYMAKSQLHKIEKYARKLQQMIPEGYDLDDWMRTHISQAADDLGEVYHKLEYDYHSGH